VKPSLTVRLLVGSGVIALVVAAAVLALVGGTAALDEATDKRAAARLGLDAVSRVEKDVLDLETGLRGFVITRQEPFLEPWLRAERRLTGDVARLRERVQHPTANRALASALAHETMEYLRDYTRPVIQSVRIRRLGSSSATATAAGKVRVDHIRGIVDSLRGNLDAEARRFSATGDEQAHRASRLGIGALLASTALILACTVYLLRKVVVPIRCVGSAADRLASGDLTARAPVDSIPEIIQLGASFNRMASTIQEGRAAMDARNLELADAKRDADRANQSKSAFLSRMSHELRTPLNAVLGYAQLLELDHLDADQRESVNQIGRAGRHLLHLIDEVLDISRVEAGEMRLSREPTEATELIEEALALVAPLAEQRSIRLITDFASCGDGHVMADRQRLKQILLNLLSNAIKYNREAGEIRISVQPISGEQVAIRVSDTGAGLSEQQLAKLFEPFERLGAEQRNIDGTGLGLALSRRLAEAMNGTIEVASAPGQGSTFSVCLPHAAPPDPADIERAESAPQWPISGDHTILYIEDNLSNLRLVERALARQSTVTFLPAMQASIGLELARQHRPDLVLLDLHLPDLDGDEVLIRLKADPETRDTPVIMLSADASPGQIQRLREAGAATYLTKPLDLRQLLDAVAEHLGGLPGPGAPDPTSAEARRR
jgi:signal transduction histidine kinase/ActR/RegA family two-component response regulator